MNRLTSWEEIEALSRQISELAHQDNWEELAELASKRHQLITNFFSEPVAEDIASEISKGITIIQDQDEKVVQLAQQTKKIISEHLQEIAKGKQVVEAYSHNE
jgi:hypothetical protein